MRAKNDWRVWGERNFCPPATALKPKSKKCFSLAGADFSTDALGHRGAVRQFYVRLPRPPVRAQTALPVDDLQLASNSLLL